MRAERCFLSVLRAGTTLANTPRFALSILLLTLAICHAIAQPDASSMRRQLFARFGAGRVDLLNSWIRLLAVTGGLPREEDKLRRINDFFNQNITFDEDANVWQRSDYWATPLETIARGRGDCEDFAIAKYFSLRLSGVALSKLRLVYVKARLTTEFGDVPQAHMVLAYYARPTAEPLVLDNLQAGIRPAAQRPDLQPVFSFNSEGVFAGAAGTQPASAGGVGRLSRWQDLLLRARAEGFD